LDLWNNLIKNKSAKILLNIILMRRFRLLHKLLSLVVLFLFIFCSAGAGRSGTFIAFENLMQELRETNKMDPMKAVLKMRENRKDMVQNEVRFLQQLFRNNK